MDKKLMIVFGALFVIVSAFIVASVADSNDGAETNDEVVSLDDIIGSNTYWVKGTLSSDGTLTLTNNDGGKDAIVALYLEDESKNVKKVVTESLTVPADSALACAFFDGEKVVGYELHVTKSLNVNGTIFGGIMCDAKDVVFTFTKATVGGFDYGYSLPCYIFVQGNDAKFVFTNTVVHALMFVVDGAYNGITFNNTMMKDVTINYDGKSTANKRNGWTLNGKISDNAVTTGISYISLGDDNNSRNADGYFLNQLNLSGLYIRISFISVQSISVRAGADNEVDYSDCVVVCNNPDIFKFISCQDKGKTISIYTNYSSGSLFDRSYGVKLTYDYNGLTGAYFGLRLHATEGIASIDDSFRYVEVNGTIDLTTISVKCKDGYTFDGWYYLDSNGVLSKIQNPSKLTVYNGMILYAFATPDMPSPSGGGAKDYTMLFAGMIALLAIILVVNVVGLVRKK